MFPKLNKLVTPTYISLEQKFVGKIIKLTVDRMRCVGCGICSRVCPKAAISFGPAATLSKSNSLSANELMVKSIDEQKCVFCGACTILCPFDAIHLSENGERLPADANNLVIKHAIPALSIRKVPMTRTKHTANVYWEGKISVDYPIPENEKDFHQKYLDKCPGDCKKCAQICPNEAISFVPFKEALETHQVVQIDDEKCIKCGSCQMICPQSAFNVTWTQIHSEGEYNERFWAPLMERLMEN